MAHKHSTLARVIAATLAASLALGLAGCATPMLDSTVAVPDQFAAASTVASAPEVAWWERYEDPALSELIRRAARENRDVKIAAERVRAARAGETISRSSLLPNFGAVGSRGVERSDYSGRAQDAVPDVESASGGLSVSWEVDLSGRLRAGAAAAAADRKATEDHARGVRLLVLSDVASNYFTLVGALQQLDTVRAISAAQDETLRLVTARHRAGLASAFDVERARTDAASAHAAIPPLSTLAAAARHRIAVLIGSQAADASTIKPSSGNATVPEIQPGQPAELLERRPDLLASRAQLQAANFRRRQAAAEWFPRLFVSALFGSQNAEVNAFDLGSARFSNVSNLLTMPILDWGRTRAVNEIAGSGQNEALLRYEDAIVRALEDVENALVSLRDQRLRAEALQSATASADAALGRAQSLYDRGQIDLLPLLDAQRTRLSVRINSNESNTRVLLATVDLFKALGGGWQAFEPPATPKSANADHSSHSQILVSTKEEQL
ncbi:MAG TPA: TolC family protein [Steroidobacteraceae bacterium]|nr:TolC family protein [Steroidobacteraceae bacterium]